MLARHKRGDSTGTDGARSRAEEIEPQLFVSYNLNEFQEGVLSLSRQSYVLILLQLILCSSNQTNVGWPTLV